MPSTNMSTWKEKQIVVANANYWQGNDQGGQNLIECSWYDYYGLNLKIPVWNLQETVIPSIDVS